MIQVGMHPIEKLDALLEGVQHDIPFATPSEGILSGDEALDKKCSFCVKLRCNCCPFRTNQWGVCYENPIMKAAKEHLLSYTFREKQSKKNCVLALKKLRNWTQCQLGKKNKGV